MTIDVYTATGTKKGTAELSAALFGAPINTGLMHQAVMLQQGNRRASIANSLTRSEIRGSTRKLFAQKGTGRARRGSVRSPLLKGGNKAFGPRSVANFSRNMPHSMRRAALLSSLSYQAKRGVILGLENYPDAVKTKEAHALLKKLPVALGRSILFVLPEKHSGLSLSVRNIPRVKTLLVNYLNPEDILAAHHVIFLTEALTKAEQIFTAKKQRVAEEAPAKVQTEKKAEKPSVKPKTAKKAPAKKAAKSSKQA
ncbi:MAG TPA: 50S ribosomal protein L4 [Candidatus Peribacter riflensis]|uniref:Large ribosomal subunit protein uL4 n=1 Tax=Candidatus Peribacter riflensis TaxID=1735162 RepID=A0A0S1SJA6_9BACT|nr:MAG: 50S ribosomal protein L4 [Candidatus Peribacter riflensis]OGJ82216.1 MAG: 50S ribosomal protein L4 [Candidatus Peribacteria bacterium RIFOXYC1_FULL_58_8]ALM10507.1 MAG: large subunit ribosomal protein L4 [Candidatus Peribacter riflensis]ALM11610.1 MAG: large subunit ribosomal protein L4 [Candidatus Peribacter riflensis]ALM12712.1 MAG: large subunit ribosomal protein L4 [Candidatus Peribacter riflensis]